MVYAYAPICQVVTNKMLTLLTKLTKMLTYLLTDVTKPLPNMSLEFWSWKNWSPGSILINTGPLLLGKKVLAIV